MPPAQRGRAPGVPVMALQLKKKCPFSWVAIDDTLSDEGVPQNFKPYQGTRTENGCMAWVTCDDDRAPGYCQLIEHPEASLTVGDDP